MIRKKRKKPIDLPKAIWGTVISAGAKASQGIYDKGKDNLNKDENGNVIYDDKAKMAMRRSALLNPYSSMRDTLSSDAYTGGQKALFAATDILGLGNFTANRKTELLEEHREEQNAIEQYKRNKEEAANRLSAQNVREDRNMPLFESGGKIPVNGQGDFREDDVDEIKGETHEKGGTNISNIVEAEKGETIYDGYIFSDDLKITEDKVKEYNLPEKYVGKTLSEISKKLKEKYSLRENDVFDEPARKSELDALKEIQEDLKLDKFKDQIDKLSKKNPEFLQQLAQSMQPAQQQSQQGITPQQQGMEQEMQQQGMPQQQLPQMLYGGNIGDPPEGDPDEEYTQFNEAGFAGNFGALNKLDVRFLNELMNSGGVYNYGNNSAGSNRSIVNNSPSMSWDVVDGNRVGNTKRDLNDPWTISNVEPKYFPESEKENIEKNPTKTTTDPVTEESTEESTGDDETFDSAYSELSSLRDAVSPDIERRGTGKVPDIVPDPSGGANSTIGGEMKKNIGSPGLKGGGISDDGLGGLEGTIDGYNKFRVGDNLGNIYSIARGVKGLLSKDQHLERFAPDRLTASYMDPSRAVGDMTTRASVNSANAVSSVGGAGASNAMGLISRTALARSIGRVNQQYDEANVGIDNATRRANARLAEKAKAINLEQSNREMDINDRNKAVSSNEIQQALANASTISQMRERERNQLIYQNEQLKRMGTQNLERKVVDGVDGWYYRGTNNLAIPAGKIG